MMRLTLLAAMASLLFVTAAGAGETGPVFTVEVSAGEYGREQCPVVVDLPDSIAAASTFSLTPDGDDHSVPVQKMTGEPARVVFLLDQLAAGSTRRYRLRAVPPAAPASPAVTAIDGRRAVSFRLRDKPVLVYHRAVVNPPEGIDPVFRRSGFIHPLRTPAGKIITDDFPPDHAHQHGIFFAWVATRFEGREVDFWNQAKKQGDVEHFTLKDIRSGEVFAQLTVVLRHLDKTAPQGPKPALEETWTIRVYNVAAPFLIDLESEQRTAGSSPLDLLEYRYGGFAMRGARQWFGQPGSGFLTSEGKDRETGNHTRPRWVEIFGKVGGADAGALLMGSPRNFRFPQPVRLHPTKPYLCFAPVVAGPFRIQPAELFVSRYRIATHDGPPEPAENERLWHDYAEPPAVRVLP